MHCVSMIVVKDTYKIYTLIDASAKEVRDKIEELGGDEAVVYAETMVEAF